MSASTVEPHDKMRSRDVSKVSRGEQAPRPPQRSPHVSQAPPPPSTNPKSPDPESRGSEKESVANQMRRCYESYHEYHRCIEEKGAEAEECKKIGDYYKSRCPEWIGSWRIH